MTTEEQLAFDILRDATMKDINDTLAERGTRYGNFDDQAMIGQTLKAEIMASINFGQMPDRLRMTLTEAVEQICTKLARIANGDPSYIDNWRDIAGYAQLAINQLLKDTNNE